MMKTLLSCFIGTAMLLSAPAALAESFYKWVDAKGTTHYTTTPPPKTAKSHSKINTYGMPEHLKAAAASNNPAATEGKGDDKATTNKTAEGEKKLENKQESKAKTEANKVAAASNSQPTNKSSATR